MIKKLVSVALCVSCALSINATIAQDKAANKDQIPVFKVEKEQETSCRRVYGFYTRSHYKEISLDDDAFIKKIIERYIDTTDYTHTLLTKAEADDIFAQAKKFKAAAKECKLDFPYELYHTILKRRYDRYSYYLELLDKPIEFDSDETIALDHSKLDYPKDYNELKNLWRLAFKSDFLNLKLSGKSDNKVRELLRKRYNNVMRTLKQSTNEDAFSVFINSFATAIDPHTSYLSPENTSNFENSMNLSMEGIGAVLQQEDDYVKIVSLVPGSPAEKSKKLKPKDLIIGVQQHKEDDHEMLDVVGMRLVDVVPLVKGPKGSKVTLEIQRGDNIFKVDLVRNTIKLEDSAAKGEVKTINGRKVGVLTVKSFYVNLSEDMKKEIQKLTKANVEAMVVDLRSNGGGLLQEASLSTGLFIKSGPVVQVRNSLGEISSHSDRDGQVYYDGPLVVLIDRFSASSSEIFAGALQDYGRALIVGDTSFGKGTVQRTQSLDRIYDFSTKPLGSIHFTTAMYYRINGGSNQKKGVQPDISFPSLYNHKLIGEEQHPNVLEYNQIDSMKYKPYADLKPVIPQLQANHLKRIKDDYLFNYIIDRAQKDADYYDKNFVSLNYNKRLAEKNETEKAELDYVNTFLTSQGKKVIKNIKELPDNFTPPDAFLDEAMNIALDLADARVIPGADAKKARSDNSEVMVSKNEPKK